MKTCAHGRAEHEHEQPPEPERERDAHRRRHDEPERVVRVVVVDAVDDPVEPGADALLGLEVEDQPVHPVLGERPEDVAAEHQADHLNRRRLAASADRERDHDRRHEDDQRDHRMDAREPVEEVRVEHPR